MANNNDNLEVETEFPGWVPLFQLKVLVLSGCNLNKLSGHIPRFLWHQSKLRIVDLSHNKSARRFPHWLLVNNNQFIGSLSNVISRMSWLELLDVSNNHMSGEIPRWIGTLKTLRTLYISLAGYIHATFLLMIPSTSYLLVCVSSQCVALANKFYLYDL